jgi:plasmid segregation protein ParM
MFVIDIGGYTTDVLLLRNGKPDLQFCSAAVWNPA